jgi:hypothetical protein
LSWCDLFKDASDVAIAGHGNTNITNITHSGRRCECCRG